MRCSVARIANSVSAWGAPEEHSEPPQNKPGTVKQDVAATLKPTPPLPKFSFVRALAVAPIADRLAGLFVVFAASSYSVICFRLGLQRYQIYRAGYDDGIFMQVFGSAFEGFHATAEGNFNHLAVHFSPFLFVIAPFMIATRSAVAMIALQAVAGGLVALPLFLVARKRMSPYLAAGCASVSLLYPALCGVVTSDFHEHGFTPAAVAWTLWAVDAARLRTAIVCGLIALCIKEDVAVGFLANGVVGGLILQRRAERVRARIAFLIAVAALAVLVGYFAVLRPLLHVPFGYWSLHFYFAGGATTSPAGFAGPFSPIRPKYVLDALIPLLGLPLLSPTVLLALPGFLEVLASREAITMSLATQYAAVWIPYVLFAFVLGVAAVAQRSRRAALFCLIATAVVSRHALLIDDPLARWYYDYGSPMRAMRPSIVSWRPSRRKRISVYCTISTRISAVTRMLLSTTTAIGSFYWTGFMSRPERTKSDGSSAH